MCTLQAQSCPVTSRNRKLVDLQAGIPRKTKTILDGMIRQAVNKMTFVDLNSNLALLSIQYHNFKGVFHTKNSNLTYSFELILTHDVIEEGLPIWQTRIHPHAQLCNGNIGSWL